MHSPLVALTLCTIPLSGQSIKLCHCHITMYTFPPHTDPCQFLHYPLSYFKLSSTSTPLHIPDSQRSPPIPQQALAPSIYHTNHLHYLMYLHYLSDTQVHTLHAARLTVRPAPCSILLSYVLTWSCCHTSIQHCFHCRPALTQPFHHISHCILPISQWSLVLSSWCTLATCTIMLHKSIAWSHIGLYILSH